MVCDQCGLVWDRDDDDPPECKIKSSNTGVRNIDVTFVVKFDDPPVEPGDHDTEIRKIKGMLDDENNDSTKNS